MLVLANHEDWEGALGFDQFSELIVKLRAPPWQVGPFKRGEWTEVDDYRLRHWLSSKFCEAKEKDIMQAVTLVAHEHKFHPLIERMDALKWDGISRVRSWLIDYLGVCKGKQFERLALDDRDRLVQYTELTGLKWLVGAVARVYEAAKPNAITGCQMDMMLILEGEQGIMKSTAFRVLGGEWFTDEKLDFNNKDSMMILQGRHIIEMAELEGMGKAEASATKNFITKREDLFRAPYGRKLEKKPRRVAFCGSVNHQSDYFKDDSGNRRFFPAYCTLIDIEKLKADVDQLWAEALFCYRDGVKWWIEPHERELFAFEQDKRFQEDIWRDLIEEYCIGRDCVSVGEILEQAIKMEKSRWEANATKRVGSILGRRMGWIKSQVSVGGKRPRMYFRPDVNPAEAIQGPKVSDDEAF